ncbi:conserved hypothetical protein [Leishmania mexicana MHOM/GT/2001/U1103]|uniref:Uncharacterized protein n=1 Tax=Leishmania mexicana (strain MHOM/GT/2001/U1103) TaxID=929439 RepID=E9B4P7_LEIMU|nr:conserved hypothetical protein [Leishmania mexicana MHOM/GT/2001/U1103]CBZ30216.1 conserved hypothetical protein [Leishmania mexicana MHOM/GT/2001/U1103]
MNLLASRPLNRYDDEANNAAYMENEPFHVLPPERSTAGNSSESDSSTYGSRRTAGDGSGKRDVLSMQHVMNMTESLQKEQEDREAREKVDKVSDAERMRQVRNVQWEAVRKRMSQRAMSLHSVRAYDSEDDEEEVELKSVHTALSALVPSLTEERATRRGGFQAAETMPERFCHFVYNWLMYFVYAFSASALPGMDVNKGADSREYFDRRVR